MKKILVFAAVAAVGMISMSTTASAFNTKKCAVCHNISTDKIGPAWTEDVKAYGTEEALAKDFLAGFKDRKVAAANPKWKGKEGLMTGQFNHLIKGHEKEAAHAVFESVKKNAFGDY